MVAITQDLVHNLKQRSRLGASRAYSGFFNSNVTKLGSVGYKDLGASNPGSTNIEIPKEIYNTTTGSPATDKYKDVTKWSGKITTELFEYSSLAIQESVGTTLTSAVVAATTTAYAGTIAVSGSSNDMLNGSALLSLHGTNAITNSLFPGDTVAVMLGTVNINGGTWVETSRVVERDTTLNTITLEGTLTDVPPAGAAVTKIIYENNYFGGNDLDVKKFRLVTTTRNGDMFVLFCNKGGMTGAQNPNLGDGSSAILFPIEFEAIGQAVSLAGYDMPQVVVAEHTIIRVVKSS
jgi:hypothetical protein